MSWCASCIVNDPTCVCVCVHWRWWLKHDQNKQELCYYSKRHGIHLRWQYILRKYAQRVERVEQNEPYNIENAEPCLILSVHSSYLDIFLLYHPKFIGKLNRTRIQRCVIYCICISAIDLTENNCEDDCGNWNRRSRARDMEGKLFVAGAQKKTKKNKKTILGKMSHTSRSGLSWNDVALSVEEKGYTRPFSQQIGWPTVSKRPRREKIDTSSVGPRKWRMKEREWEARQRKREWWMDLLRLFFFFFLCRLSFYSPHFSLSLSLSHSLSLSFRLPTDTLFCLTSRHGDAFPAVYTDNSI